jgi:hypothetical protein
MYGSSSRLLGEAIAGRLEPCTMKKLMMEMETLLVHLTLPFLSRNRTLSRWVLHQAQEVDSLLTAETEATVHLHLLEPWTVAEEVSFHFTQRTIKRLLLLEPFPRINPVDLLSVLLHLPGLILQTPILLCRNFADAFSLFSPLLNPLEPPTVVENVPLDSAQGTADNSAWSH